VRTVLYEAAHIMLTKPVKGCSALKSWAMRIARRAGMNKAKEGGTRAQTSGYPAPDARQRNVLQRRCCGSLTGRSNTVFGRVTTPGLLEAKSLRRDDGSGQTARFAVALRPRGLDLADLILF
jgi:hypothetical protein